MWIQQLTHYDRQMNELACVLQDWSLLLKEGLLSERCKICMFDQLETDVQNIVNKAQAAEDKYLAAMMVEERQHLIQSLRCRLCHQLHQSALKIIQTEEYCPSALRQLVAICQGCLESTALSADTRTCLEDQLTCLQEKEKTHSNSKKFASERSHPTSLTRAIRKYVEATGAVLGRHTPHWTELVHEGKGKYNNEHVHTRWKIHVAPSKEGAGPVLQAIAEVLAREQPYCWVVPGEHQLADFAGIKDEEGGYPNRGKFLTIFPRTEEEALYLAHQLDAAIEASGLANDAAVAPCTDRPVGSSGYVWAKHDQSGKPLYIKEFRHGKHAASQHGNYRQCQVLNTNNEVQDIRLVKDIFEPVFGPVEWQNEEQCFRKAS